MALPRLRRTAGLVLLASGCAAGVGEAQKLKVTLLGTGCPPPVMNRFGPSTLVEAGGQTLLFDVGRGALQRLNQLGVPWRNVQGVFFTHLHSDHVVGFPDAWLTGWLIAPGRTVPLRVWGPDGTARMMVHLREAYDADIRFRIANDRVTADGALVQATDVDSGVVYDVGGVKVTTFEVDHSPVKPALGYRIDYDGHSVVLSGDTRVSDAVVQRATGVDVLIHEVFDPETLRRIGVPPERAQSIVAYHTTPEEAGRVFAAAKPKLAVFSHICTPDATDDNVLRPTRKNYQGRLELGEDLMVIEVGPEIEVRRPARKSP